MHLLTDATFLARLQFTLTTMFHITWPPLTIGLAVFLVYLEIRWLRSKNPLYLRHFKFWTRLFLLCFAVGVVSGIPLEFQFGTNWGPFSRAVGSFFGQILGFAGTMAFMLESAFLWIMAFGWERVPPLVHLFSTLMVALGTSLSAFWIMVANSWMQAPAGGRMVDGVFRVEDWWAATFNPDLWYAFAHMWVACLQTTAYAVGGVSAWYLLKGRHTTFFTKSFTIAVAAVLVIAPLQVFIGDLNGQEIGRLQPAKVAAIESHWETNLPGRGATWNMLAWPDTENERNRFQIPIPYVLSLLITRSFTGQVPGLKDFPPEDRPPIVIPFYTFRLMVGIGFAMVFLALGTFWAMRRGWFDPEAQAPPKTSEVEEEESATAPPPRAWKRERLRPWLFRAWMAMGPLALLAVETGWVTREVGRQPWVVYNLIRTSEGASSLPAGSVGTTLVAYFLAYSALGVIFLLFAWRILKKGPPDPERGAY